MKEAISTCLDKRGISFTRALSASMDTNCLAVNPSGLSISTRPALAFMTGKALSLMSPTTRTSRPNSSVNWVSILSL